MLNDKTNVIKASNKKNFEEDILHWKVVIIVVVSDVFVAIILFKS